MYASPVVYPSSMVPERWKLLYSLNPMVGVIEGFRWALLGRKPGVCCHGDQRVAVLVSSLAAWCTFARMERYFAE